MSEPEERKQIMRSQGQMDLHLIHCISQVSGVHLDLMCLPYIVYGVIYIDLVSRSPFFQAVQRQMPGLALDLTTSLNLSKSIDTAIKLAAKKQMPMLAERMYHAFVPLLRRRL